LNLYFGSCSNVRYLDISAFLSIDYVFFPVFLAIDPGWKLDSLMSLGLGTDIFLFLPEKILGLLKCLAILG